MVTTPVPRLPDDLPISQPRYVGQDVPRLEDPLLLTGRAEYGDNIRLPGMLHAAILRSPHPHARIVRAVCGAAAAMGARS